MNLIQFLLDDVGSIEFTPMSISLPPPDYIECYADVTARAGNIYSMRSNGDPVRVTLPAVADDLEHVTINAMTEDILIDGCPDVSVMRIHESIRFVMMTLRDRRSIRDARNYRQKSSKRQHQLRKRRGKRFRWVTTREWRTT